MPGEEFDPIEFLTELMSNLPEDQISLSELIHYIGRLQGENELMKTMLEIEDK